MFFVFCNDGTFEAADAAHRGEHGGLHFNVPHSGLVRFPQILQLLLGRERAEGPVQPALACTERAELVSSFVAQGHRSVADSAGP